MSIVRERRVGAVQVPGFVGRVSVIELRIVKGREIGRIVERRLRY